MRALVEMLYRRYGSQNRVILISNNETDEKLREVCGVGLQACASRVTRDLQLRMQGVEEARSRFPHAALKVLFGVEVKYWRLKLDDGTNALETVLPKLHYDFVSFSAWETMAHPETLAASLDDIAARTRAGVTPEGRAVFGDHHVLVGEFGHAREWPQPAAPIYRAVCDALVSHRTPYAIYWQLYDNAKDGVRKFGLLDPRDRAIGEIPRCSLTPISRNP